MNLATKEIKEILVSASTPSQSVRICFCHGVDESTIREAIRKGADTLDKIQSETCASTGCGGCQADVEQILADELAKIKKKK